MNGDLADQIQRDQQREEIEDNAIQVAILSALKNLHTSMPGIVKSYDAGEQTVTAAPAIQRLFLNGIGWKNLPAIENVPVVFPQGGDFAHTFPVSAGDECLLVFGERAIDNWFSDGGVQRPSEYRLHDYSDAMAVMGVRSNPRKLTNVATDASELRTVDGATVFRLEKEFAIVGQALLAELAIKGETYRKTQQTLHQAMQGTLTSMASACTGPLSPLQAGFQALATAINAFELGDSLFLAQKAKVG